ncbi:MULTISPECIES: DUF4265 domain-containing protein [Pseudomonas]|uniref:DUF4265 domain-containing protein n=1 Tax=Pseudomonas TaxID=286 RepID=UPI002097784D|nr:MULTISPECIES: DUF4265 domain-containing protein [Pseudomonas chlororaphis group]MCO7575099.1 DUF4265 domain-containing protein [Pseudomonas protegens]MCO7582019.1 DUF4265 domain-containing protein [Pseudomonas chlororaphis]MCO7598533.1 DUF4265 domain-containing protein [Pseudomonas chlororaphis]
MDTSTAQFHKIIFKLTVDADGYPPVGYESMWGIQRGAGAYELDNTPCYLYGVSKGACRCSLWISRPRSVFAQLTNTCPPSPTTNISPMKMPAYSTGPLSLRA